MHPCGQFLQQALISVRLSVCVLSFLPKVNTLRSLMATNLVTKAIWIFEFVTRPHAAHVMKGSCGFKGSRLSRYFMGGSLSRWVTTLPGWWLLVVWKWRFCHATSLNDAFKGSCNVISRNFSLPVPTLPLVLW